MRISNDYLFYILQAGHDVLSKYDFKQVTPRENAFVYQAGSGLFFALPTKSQLNIIRVNPVLVENYTSPDVKERFFSGPLPDDDLFQLSLFQKPADYVSDIDCEKSCIISNAFKCFSNKYFEFIYACNDSCYCFRLPAALLLPPVI